MAHPPSNRPFLTRIRNLIFGGDADPTTDVSKPDTMTPPAEEPRPFQLSVQSALDEILRDPQGRVSRYDLYDHCESNHPEIARALDTYADYTASGSAVEGGDDYSVRVVGVTDLDGQIADVNLRTMLPRHSWDIVRHMVKYGDDFVQIIYRDDGISRLVRMPVCEMYRNQRPDGTLVPDRAFVQASSGHDTVSFERWQMAHFKIGGDLGSGYGTSILHSLTRTCREIELIETALTLARLTKATRRLVFKVPVGTKFGDEAERHVKNFEERYKRHRALDIQGNIRSTPANLIDSGDIFMGVNDESKNAGVEQLPGDPSIARIKDVEHKMERLFAGLRASKAWYGLTGPNVRAVVNEQTLSFMRAARRVRRSFESEATVVYALGLISLGVDRDFLMGQKMRFTWPVMTHIDDEARMRLLLLKIAVGERMQMNGWLSDRDVLVRIVGFDDSEVDALIAAARLTPLPDRPGGRSRTASAMTLPQPESTMSLDNIDEARGLVDDDVDLSTQVEELHALVVEMMADVEGVHEIVLDMSSAGNMQ